MIKTIPEKSGCSTRPAPRVGGEVAKASESGAPRLRPRQGRCGHRGGGSSGSAGHGALQASSSFLGLSPGRCQRLRAWRSRSCRWTAWGVGTCRAASATASSPARATRAASSGGIHSNRSYPGYTRGSDRRCQVGQHHLCQYRRLKMGFRVGIRRRRSVGRRQGTRMLRPPTELPSDGPWLLSSDSCVFKDGETFVSSVFLNDPETEESVGLQPRPPQNCWPE